MTDKEKLEAVLKYVTKMENRFYSPIENGKYEAGSLAAFQCQFQASAYQSVRYFIENIMECE